MLSLRPAEDLSPFPSSVAASADNEVIVMLEKQQMEMDEMVLTLSVFLWAWERERWEQTWALDTLILYFSMVALTWSSVMSHDLRRVISRGDLGTLSAQNWVLQAPLRRARGCRLAAAQGAQRRCWSAWFSWGQRTFRLNRKNRSKFLCRAGGEFSAIKCDFYRIQSFHGKLSLSTEEFRCFHWEKGGEMVWTNWPWCELFPLLGRPEPV